MKKDVHPKNYRPVIFVDNASGARFLLYSTIETSETGTWEDGKEYPLYTVEISSASHPVYTGEKRTIDATGRVEKFRARQQAAAARQQKK